MERENRDYGERVSDNNGWAENRCLPFSSSSYPSGRHFWHRFLAPPSLHPSSSSFDHIFLPPPPRVLRRLASSSSSFSFLSSFFVVFVVFIPRDDRGIVYMCVLEKCGGFGGIVGTGIGRFKHMGRRWVWRLWGEDSTVSWWHPGMCVRIHHVTKNVQRSRRRRTEWGRISPLTWYAQNMPCVVIGQENSVSQVERRHSDATPDLGGLVCVVFGD